MADSLTDQLRRAYRVAEREFRRPTHWLLTFDAFDQLRSEHRDQLAWSAGEQPDRYMGLPVYLARELGPPDFLLRDGEPPDDLREAELRRQLRAIQRDYMDKSRPLIDELAKLEARKPPRPMLIPERTGGLTFPR